MIMRVTMMSVSIRTARSEETHPPHSRERFKQPSPCTTVIFLTAAMVARVDAPLPIAVLVSGVGTNLQALLDTVHGREAQVVAVASSVAGAPALERAAA